MIQAISITFSFLLFSGGILIADPRKSGHGSDFVPQELSAPTSDLLTDEQLQALRENRGATKSKITTKKPRTFGFLEMSDFVTDGTDTVILPKGSVLFCPEKHSKRILKAPKGKIISFNAFIAANRNWITTLEVSPQRIRGNEPITDEERVNLEKAGKIVISTMRQNPVTVIKKPKVEVAKP